METVLSIPGNGSPLPGIGLPFFGNGFPLRGNEYDVRQYNFDDFNATHLGKVKIQVFHFLQDFTICLLM